MAAGSKALVGGVVIAALGVAVAAVMLRSEMRCAGFAGPGVSATELPSRSGEGAGIRAVYWNLRRFPIDEQAAGELSDGSAVFEPRTNICDLEQTLVGLDADLLLLTEVCDTRRFPPIMERLGVRRSYASRLSIAGGTYGEHLAIIWDQQRLEMAGAAIEVGEVAVDPARRPALATRLRSRTAEALELGVIVMHLEEAPAAGATRQDQARALVQWLADPPPTWPDDLDLVVAGTVAPGNEAELAALDSLLAQAGLRRLELGSPCTRYAENESGLVGESSDLVWVRGLSVEGPAQAWLHCRRLGCAELPLSEAVEDATLWDLSDHCPVTIELVEQSTAPAGETADPEPGSDTSDRE